MRQITQEDLANAIGISRQAMVSIEANKYNCSIQVAKILAEFFKVSVDEIFFLPHQPIVYPNVNRTVCPKMIFHEKQT